jgi:hypothetical protein
VWKIPCYPDILTLMRVFTVLGTLLVVAMVTGTVLSADEAVSTVTQRLPRRLVLSTADTAPFSTSRGDGLYDRMIRAALADLGVELEIRRLPSLRGLVEASEGRIDGEYGRAAIALTITPTW